MAYEKQNFVDGKVLTADQLNHMEDGIVNATIPIYNVSDLTREQMLELAKNRTIHIAVKDVSWDYSNRRYTASRPVVDTYYARKAYYDDCAGNMPAEVYAYDGWNVADVTDEEAQEILNAWGVTSE